MSADTPGRGRPQDRETIRALTARYDRPGPRYTSYPTAVEFDERVNAAVYEERLALAAESPEAPLSLYVHLPFCEERCLFCGCHVIVTKHRDRAAPYLELLGREVEMVADRLHGRRRFAQLHLGGGTPTYYSPEQLRSFVSGVLTRFSPLPGAELAVEVDPRVTRADHLDALADLGFNRLSMGVQDFTPEVQERIHRIQTREATAEIIQHARRRGYAGINVDLIYGLPLQTPATFERTVEAVVELGVDRVAAYSFAYVPWMRGHQKLLQPAELPSREVKLELFAIARERLLSAGFEPIGMDHFARPDDELAAARREGRLRRNFQGYAVVPGDDVIGLGISAIGDVRGAYIQNVKKLSTYSRAIEDGRLPVERGWLRSADDEVRRRVIHELMCNFVVDVATVEREAGLRFSEYFADALARLDPYAREGLVTVEPGRIAATPVGELFVRNLAMCFDRYMWERHAGEQEPTFSRTV